MRVQILLAAGDPLLRTPQNGEGLGFWGALLWHGLVPKGDERRRAHEHAFDTVWVKPKLDTTIVQQVELNVTSTA